MRHIEREKLVIVGRVNLGHIQDRNCPRNFYRPLGHLIVQHSKFEGVQASYAAQTAVLGEGFVAEGQGV